MDVATLIFSGISLKKDPGAGGSLAAATEFSDSILWLDLIWDAFRIEGVPARIAESMGPGALAHWVPPRRFKEIPVERA